MANSPNVLFNIIDKSVNAITAVETLPLDKQLYAFIAQKGKANTPQYIPYAAMEREFGAETFNENNATYWSRAAFYAKQISQNNTVCCVRLAPDDAVKSNAVLYLTIQEDDVPQWTKAADGTRARDVDGDFIPLMDGATQETLPGIIGVWSVEPLPVNTDRDELVKTTTVVPDVGTFVKYPVIVFEKKDPGVCGDDTGFELYFDPSYNQTNILNITKNLMVTIRIKEIEYGTSTSTFVRDAYGKIENSFTLIDNIINTSTNINVGVSNVLKSNYGDQNLLPFDTYVYEKYVRELTTLCKANLTAAEITSMGTIANDLNANVINFINGVNPFTSVEYDTIAITTTGVIGKYITNYLQGGDDGDITQANQFAMTRNLFNMITCPQLQDKRRFPLSAVVDVGYDLATKYALMNFTDNRKDTVMVLGTYQMTVPELTESEDLAVGLGLYNRALLMRESTLYGTNACRGCIIVQSGVPNASIKNTVVPQTYWVAMKMAERYNKTFINDPMVTWPNSNNNLFKDLNWYPITQSFKDSLWGSGLNYTQFFDRTQLHVPALRSIYPYDTSKLIDFQFVLACCFIHAVVVGIGYKYFGSEDEALVRHSLIKKDIENEVGALLNNRYPFDVEVYQTYDEEQAGYIDHVTINTRAGNAMTLLNIDLVVNDPS